MKLEARDASGAMVEQPFGIMTVPSSMLASSGLVGVLAMAGAVMAIRRGGGLGWTLGILAVLVALTGIGFVGFAIWGRYSGMPWTFAPPAAP